METYHHSNFRKNPSCGGERDPPGSIIFLKIDALSERRDCKSSLKLASPHTSCTKLPTSHLIFFAFGTWSLLKSPTHVPFPSLPALGAPPPLPLLPPPPPLARPRALLLLLVVVPLAPPLLASPPPPPPGIFAIGNGSFGSHIPQILLQVLWGRGAIKHSSWYRTLAGL